MLSLLRLVINIKKQDLSSFLESCQSLSSQSVFSDFVCISYILYYLCCGPIIVIKYYVTKRDEVNGQLRVLHNEEFCDLYRSLVG
jgi:hypothetical protein